jgi:hypothetical protein
MVRAQHLAWLFASPEQALAAGARPLAALRPDEVARPDLLPLLRHDAAELLFCAALLEHEAWSSLPVVRPGDEAALEEAIRELHAVAPRLPGCALASLRSLGIRGRVASEEIWVGAPGWGAATTERCAWQAAHEATVLEVSERWPAEASSHEAREARAVALLRDRARAAGRQQAHARWISAFTVPAPW